MTLFLLADYSLEFQIWCFCFISKKMLFIYSSAPNICQFIDFFPLSYMLFVLTFIAAILYYSRVCTLKRLKCSRSSVKLPASHKANLGSNWLSDQHISTIYRIQDVDSDETSPGKFPLIVILLDFAQLLFPLVRIECRKCALMQNDRSSYSQPEWWKPLALPTTQKKQPQHLSEKSSAKLVSDHCYQTLLHYYFDALSKVGP